MKNFGKTIDIKDIITVGYEADNAVLYSTSQSLTNNQKAQARTNIGAGTSSFDGNYNSLSNKPTIPTKTSQLNNDSNFATTSQVEAKYTKPASGIPKTDLATAVQNSLTAADNAVKYTSQSLTDAQKVQARTNIGAGTSNFSGSYNDLTNRPSIPAAVSIVQSTGTSTSSVMSQKATTDAVNGKLSKTDNTNIEVLGTKKATTTLGGNQLYAPNGVIFGGSAAAAGLVTRGICGVSTPSVGGACTKENLYINYDGNNDFNAGRQIVLNAGTTGSHLGSNMYQYTVPRGDIVKNWVEAKGYATSVKVNGNTIASSGGVVDIGTVLMDASKFATAAQGSNADSALAKANANATEISNIKNGTNGTKVKYAEHADAADSATSAGTADKVANRLNLGGGVVYDGSKALSISAGNKISINGGPGGISIDLAYSVMPSTYNKVTVDGYGTVTAGENVNYLTSHQSIKKLNTNNTAAQDPNASEAIVGTGAIDLHKIAKTGSYDDLNDKPNRARHSSTLLATNTDLNTLHGSDKVGWYHCGGSNNCKHKPTGVDAFGLEVGRSAEGYYFQVLTDGNAHPSRRYVRTYGSAWTAWQKLAITSEIPAVNDGTLTIQKNGTAVATFTANSALNTIANIKVPSTFDDLSRIRKQAYAGNNNAVKYFKLATFPVYNSDGNYASFIITGRMGGRESGNTSFVNMILYNRNGEGGGYINVANSAFFNLCDIVMYREADGTSTAYLKVKSYYTFDINVNTYQATNVYTGTDDTPTGTLKWTASEQADRLAVSGGVAYVNGFTLPKQVEINGETVNPNSAGLINLGTGFAKTADLPIKSATLTGTTLTITL